MRHRVRIAMTLLLWTTESQADRGFDQCYERDYNIFTPANTYNPNVPFALLDRKNNR